MKIIILLLLVILPGSVLTASAQVHQPSDSEPSMSDETHADKPAQRPDMIALQETAQIIVDRTGSQGVTASVTLQTISLDEMMIPAGLEQEIREDGRISEFIVTNIYQCVPGVGDQSCIMINVKRNPEHDSIMKIQDSARTAAELYIDEINRTFGTNAEYHSVFIHTDGSGSEIVLDQETASVVYTMPMERTDAMYDRLTTSLVHESIIEGGGFYDVAEDLSQYEDAKMMFVMTPLEAGSLMQMRLSVEYKDGAQDSPISPLGFLQVDRLERSGYFSGEEHPLSSLIQTVLISPENVSVSDAGSAILETRLVDGEEVPLDVSMPGWVFDPIEGQIVHGKFIFGDLAFVDAPDLEFAVDAVQSPPAENDDTDEPPIIPGQPAGHEGDHWQGQRAYESIIIIGVIVAAGVGAILLYMRGYKR